jgi:hypothetical protein
MFKTGASSTYHDARVAPLSTVYLPPYRPTRTTTLGAERDRYIFSKCRLLYT